MIWVMALVESSSINTFSFFLNFLSLSNKPTGASPTEAPQAPSLHFAKSLLPLPPSPSFPCSSTSLKSLTSLTLSQTAFTSRWECLEQFKIAYVWPLTGLLSWAFSWRVLLIPFGVTNAALLLPFLCLLFSHLLSYHAF